MASLCQRADSRCDIFQGMLSEIDVERHGSYQYTKIISLRHLQTALGTLAQVPVCKNGFAAAAHQQVVRQRLKLLGMVLVAPDEDSRVT